MVRRPHPARRALTVTLTAAAVVAGSIAVTTAIATPSAAATCNGYVGLTFDDGPTPGNTTNLLNALTSNGLRATMFNEGQNVAPNPSLVQAEKAAGMWIGNHTWDHPHMTQLSTTDMTSEISRTQDAIRQVTGTAPVLFRPPYGETNATLKSVESQFGLTEIIWDVDSQDWNGASVEQIVQAAGRLTDGQVILMHDWPANTVAAIPQIAANLASRNLCPGMISPATGRAVAPDGGTSTPPSNSPSASPTAGGGQAGACAATYRTVNGWTGGFQGEVTVQNTGSSAISGWTVHLTLGSGQTISNIWNAVSSGTSGSVAVTNASYNGTVGANSSTVFGFVVSGGSAAPSGLTCTSP